MSDLSLALATDQSMYLAENGSQSIHILIEATPSDNSPVSAANLNICLVLDRSGSMAGAKLQNLKEAAKHLVTQLDGQDIITVVVFDDRADVIVPACLAVDKVTINTAIDRITERGGTSMSTGMMAGLSELSKPATGERVTRLLLLTDGQTWEDQDDCRQLASQARSNGIPLSVMGLGIGEEGSWDPQFVEELASLSGGEWFLIDTPTKIGDVFASALASMKGTAITNARLTIRMASEVVPKGIVRAKPLINKLDQRVSSDRDIQVFLGDIEASDGQSLLIEAEIPQRKVQTYRLLQVEIMYDVPGQHLKDQIVRMDALITYTLDKAQCVVNRRVMNLVERVAGHIANTIALDEAEKGDPHKAAGMLRQNATHLIEIGQQDLAQQALDAAEQLDQQGQLDAGETQRLRYTTRRLTADDDGKPPEPQSPPLT